MSQWLVTCGTLRDVTVEADSFGSAVTRAFSEAPEGTQLAEVVRAKEVNNHHPRFALAQSFWVKLNETAEPMQEPMVELHAITCNCERCVA